MTVFLKEGLDDVVSTICLCCEDDYEEIAQECFIAGVCPDCIDTYSSDELLEIQMGKIP